MPELPEVQTVVNYLNSINILNTKINSIESPNGYKNVCGNISFLNFQLFLKNNYFKKIWRRGKYIVIELNSGYLFFHLRMTGQLIEKLIKPTDIKYVSIKINFKNNSKLFFRDIRKFGKTYISNNIKWLEDKLGVEPLSKKFTINFLRLLFANHNRMIKPMLLDQKFIAGLGNIYIDEVLWEAKIHPKSICSNINNNNIDKLYFAIKYILSQAIKFQGTTIIDFNYGLNKQGNFKENLKVFRREGKCCYRCKAIIKKIFIAQRGTHYCKTCQSI